MNWYVPPGVSFWDYVNRPPASRPKALHKAPPPKNGNAQAEQRVSVTNVREITPQHESAETPPNCGFLVDGLKVCWNIDRDSLTAEVMLTPSDESADGARLTTTRPIGELTLRGEAVQAEMLAALDVWERQIYLKGWAISMGRRREIDRVLK